MALRLRRVGSNVLRVLLVAIFIFYPIVLGLDYFYVFEPYLYPLHMLQGHIRPVGRHILIGPYPEFVSLERLHDQGVSVVISLLDPRLIYEKGLVRVEQREERELGMRAYNIPLDSYESPTSPRNAAHIREILALVRRLRNRKIYIHCYLGKHRVAYVANAIRADRRKSALISNDRQMRPAPQN
ncbi:MAG: protein-tyrosine phosphatase family protein [Acidiferrobacteraceae bacterium]